MKKTKGPKVSKPGELDKLDKFRKMYLAVAEAIDAFRTVPRLLTIGYGIMFGYIVYWYMHLATYVKTTCNEKVVELLLAHTKDLDKVASIACSPEQIVGGPVDPLGFIVAMAGLAGIIFGFYVNSGRNWRSSPFIKWNGGVDIKDLPEDNRQLAPMMEQGNASYFRQPNYNYNQFDRSSIGPRIKNVKFTEGVFRPGEADSRVVPAVHLPAVDLDAALPPTDGNNDLQ